jgi:hypothetical protein
VTAIRLLAAVAVSGFAIACQSSSSGGAAASAVSVRIGPEGGTLAAADGTRVDVPEGALPAVVTLTLQPAPGAQAPAGATFVSSQWTLQPDWLQFAKAITVTFEADVASLDGGAIVLTTAPSASGYLALAATAVDSTHVAAHASHFATGAVAAADCPATCTAASDPVGQTVSCNATCLGHAYVLSCSGPAGAPSPCTCSIDGAVVSAFQVGLADAGTGTSIYGAQCAFPSTSFTRGM